MKRKASPAVGDVVAMIDSATDCGITELTLRQGDHTEKYRTAPATEGGLLMVIAERRTDAKKAKCVHYSSKSDKFIEKWYEVDQLSFVAKGKKVISPTLYDTVRLKTAIVQPHRKSVTQKFMLNHPNGSKQFQVEKTFGTSRHSPPLMKIVKTQRRDTITTVLCSYVSPKTGSRKEVELPPCLLIREGDICQHANVLP